MKAVNKALLSQDATGNEKYCDINKKPVTPPAWVHGAAVTGWRSKSSQLFTSAREPEQRF